jgi:pilus assembly protein Flp/PilA
LRVLIVRFLNDDRGAALVEWGLLVTLIAIVVLVAASLAGTELSQTFSEIGTEIANAGA